VLKWPPDQILKLWGRGAILPREKGMGRGNEGRLRTLVGDTSGRAVDE